MSEEDSSAQYVSRPDRHARGNRSGQSRIPRRLAVRSLFRRRPLIIIYTLASMLLLLVGCGRSGLQRGSVGGQVTLDGAPIDKGSVQFVPLEGTAGPTSGAAIRGGDYYVSRAKGPALGKYRVEVYVPRKTGRKVVSAMTAQRRTRRNRSPTPDSDGKAIEDSEESEVNLNPMQAGNLVDEWADAAPPQYNKESTLELDVQSGSNTFDVHMKSE